MADPRFYAVAGPFTLQELAEISGTEMAADADPAARFEDVRPLSEAGTGHVSFLDNTRYLESFTASGAGACIVRPAVAGRAPEGMHLLLTDEPYHAYARVAWAFYPATPMAGAVATAAMIDDTAAIGAGTNIAPGAIVAAGAEIGRDCRIEATAVVGPGVVVGDACWIGAGAVLTYCIVGDRVMTNAGCRIGQDGFGFALGADGHLKVPQLGRVIIGDDVDIGVNTTIDRGSGPDTVIGAGTKIDNLVQIAHNVKIGKHCAIAAQVGISGSTELGDFVMIGGQAGLTGHLKIGNGARIGAKSGVMRDVGAGETIGGFPARAMREWLRESAVLKRLAKTKGKNDG